MEEILGYKMRIDTLKQINNGFNFGNVEKKTETSKYFMEVMLKTSMNLKEKSEKLEVRHNLFSHYSYSYGQDITNFLKELEEFAQKPIARIRNFNRKNEVRTYGFDGKFRDKTINFSDVKISIGELAEEKLKIDFKEEVKKALSLQKKKDENTQKLLDKFVFLKEKMLTLDECVGKEKRDYYGNKKEDKTMKMTLTPFQYNEKLKEIETEIREIAGKLGIQISDYDFKYIPIPKKVGFDEWFKVNRGDLKESWAMFDEDERKEYKNLKGYGEMVYDESGGEIVALDGSNEDYEEDEDEEE